MIFFKQINRNKNKWKFHLKDGIMNLNGKDFVFQKATGDAEWWCVHNAWRKNRQENMSKENKEKFISVACWQKSGLLVGQLTSRPRLWRGPLDGRMLFRMYDIFFLSYEEVLGKDHMTGSTCIGKCFVTYIQGYILRGDGRKRDLLFFFCAFCSPFNHIIIFPFKFFFLIFRIRVKDIF